MKLNKRDGECWKLSSNLIPEVPGFSNQLVVTCWRFWIPHPCTYSSSLQFFCVNLGCDFLFWFDHDNDHLNGLGFRLECTGKENNWDSPGSPDRTILLFFLHPTAPPLRSEEVILRSEEISSESSPLTPHHLSSPRSFKSVLQRHPYAMKSIDECPTWTLLVIILRNEEISSPSTPPRSSSPSSFLWEWIGMKMLPLQMRLRLEVTEIFVDDGCKEQRQQELWGYGGYRSWVLWEVAIEINSMMSA